MYEKILVQIFFTLGGILSPMGDAIFVVFVGFVVRFLFFFYPGGMLFFTLIFYPGGMLSLCALWSLWFGFLFFFYQLPATSYELNGVHEGGFDAVEDDGADDYYYNHKAKGVEEIHWVEGAST